jgi:hypothetical protein
VTVNEFIAWLNKRGIDRESELRVEAFGGMRSGKKITKASVGFDWDHGAIILHTEVMLTMYQKKDEKP